MVNLTIGGGSFKGVAFTGALEYLFINDLVTNKINKENGNENENKNEYIIKNFYGSSVGAIIGIFFLIGYTPFEILEILINLNLQDYWDFSITNIENNYSLISDVFFKKINEIFSKKENPEITFKEFYEKYKVNINIFATSLTYRKNVCFNYKTYPEYNVLKIVQASASIPIVFPPVNINNEYFIDGCIKCIDGICTKEILNDKDIHYVIKGDCSTKQINTFMDYIFETLNCTLQNEDLIETKYTVCIKFTEEYKNKLNFNDIKNSDKIKLFYIGLIQAKDKFSKLKETEKMNNTEEIKETEKMNNTEEIKETEKMNNTEEIQTINENDKSTQTDFN
jgi:NTE family protein